MNFIKTISRSMAPLALLIMVAFSSCEKDFGDINKSWDNKVYEASIPALYNSLAASLVEPGGTGNLLTGFVYQNTQLIAMYAASGYRLDNMSGAYWNNYYAALANYRKLVELIDANEEAANMTNVKNMARVIIAYQTLRTTMMYGDMPYSAAAKAFISSDNFRPVYDAQSDIIKDALAELKTAIDEFSSNSSQVSIGGSETIFGGDLAKWTKFANSIRLKYAMALHGKDAATANGIIAETLSKPLLGPADVYGLFPGTITNLEFDRNGWYQGNSYVRMGSTMWDAMSSTTDEDGSGIFDLRCKLFFEPNAFGDWAPYPQAPSSNTLSEIGNSGVNDPYNRDRLNVHSPEGAEYIYSPLNVYYTAEKTFPQVFMTGHEVSFIKAELYNRGIGGVAANAATAQEHYESGITESVKLFYALANGSSIWTVGRPNAAPSNIELSTMMSNPHVEYSSNAGTALSQIYKQHWIALFHQPFEAWNLARRTGYATPSVALASTSPGLNFYRVTYPQSEIDGNYDNWRAVTGGSDAPTVKPWFMP